MPILLNVTPYFNKLSYEYGYYIGHNLDSEPVS